MEQEKSIPSPEPDYVNGLPTLDYESLAILTRQGDVIVAKHCQITSYHLDDNKCEPKIEVEFKGLVTAIAESELGLIAAAGRAIHRVTSGGTRELAMIDGDVRSMTVAGSSVFAAVGRQGRLDGTLVEVDLDRSVIVSERSLRSAAVVVSADPTGSFVGVADGTTFRTMQVAAGRPCPDRPDPEPPKPPHDDPSLCCQKDGGKDTPHEGGTDHATTPGDHRPIPEPCDPGKSGVPTPDGSRVIGDGNGVTKHPPGGAVPWDPCRSHLFFEVHTVRLAGSHIVVADQEARNVAVLAASDLQVLHQAQYRHGAVLLTHHSRPQMLVFHRERDVWERVLFDKFTLGALEIVPKFDPEILGGSITFTGTPLPVLKGDRAPAIGSKRTLVIPALDPGQAFNDADLGKLTAYLKRTGFTHVLDFYRENSFDALNNIDFVVHGVHAGSGGPVRLQKPVKDYYYPAYIGAHVELVKSGMTFPGAVVFDGREKMTLEIQPQLGGRSKSALNVKLAALLASENHDKYPAQIKFLGTETATLSVKRPTGATATLTLKFTSKTFDIFKESDIGIQIPLIENYLNDVIAAAETVAGIPPRMFAKPVVRHIDQGTNGPGLIVTTLSHALTTGPKLEVNSIVYSGTADPLGFNGAFTGRISVNNGINTRLRDYLDFVTVLAQEDAKFNYTQRRLADAPEVTGDASAGKLITKISISTEDGGPGATMSLTGITEMSALFDTWTGVANTNVTAGRSNTPKDGNDGFDGLVNDAFTGVVDRLAAPGKHLEKKDDIAKFFAPFDTVIVGMIHPAKADASKPDFVRSDEMWFAAPSSWSVQRAVEGPRTAQYRPFPKEIQFFSNWNLVPLDVPTDFPLMCHELGHAVGFDDLYAREAGYRDDLLYMEHWAMMHHHPAVSHHSGYHKWQAGWIPDSRVFTIERPKEDEMLTREVLLVPVEHWHANDTLIGAARNSFARPDLPVVQLVELALGGDADVFGLIEARQEAAKFSKHLPHNPALLITNCIVWWDKTRYAFNGRYRAPVHLLHSHLPEHAGQPFFARLQNPGDSFDLAHGRELPVKGIVVSIIARKNVFGVEIFQVKVERKHSKEFIDLFFTKGNPYYKSPDIWVDWAGDNGPGGKASSTEKKDVHVFPLGQPDHQGEKIQVPDTGEELHWMVARLRNIGNVRAEQVKLNFSICEPPGAGDRGNFKVRDSITINQVPPTGHDKPLIEASQWLVPAGFKGHTCIMVEVADLKVPLDHTGAALASDDVMQANNVAQKNVDQIGPKSSSPFEPIEFDFSVNNSAQWPEVAYLEPQGLPYGMALTVTPKRRKIDAGETAIFRCKLELDDRIIDASCRGDHNFRINAWRVDQESSILWGGVEYQVRPRKRSTTDVNGSWYNDDVEITGHVAPGNITGRVRIRLAYTGHHARWVSADLMPGGTFSYKEKAPSNTRELFVIALFEGNKYYSESRSPQRRITPPPPIR